mgnify:CR=1 FL=1
MNRAHTPTENWGWFWQAVTGIGLLALLGLHFVAQHFVAEGGIRDFAGVIAYLRNPIIVALEAAFLIVVTWHALLGVRAVLFDLGLSDSAERRVSRVLLVIGLLTVGYGLWLTWTITRFV